MNRSEFIKVCGISALAGLTGVAIIQPEKVAVNPQQQYKDNLEELRRQLLIKHARETERRVLFGVHTGGS